MTLKRDDDLAGRILRGARARLPAEIKDCYGSLLDWIDRILIAHRGQARPLTEFALPRLAHYYPASVLDATEVIVVEECPVVPLSEFGLREDDALPAASETAGFTLRDSYFVNRLSARDESTHFHELVHVVQWCLVGDETFLHLYALGLLAVGYRSSPLERIAYDLQSRFDAGEAFCVVEEVRQGLLRINV